VGSPFSLSLIIQPQSLHNTPTGFQLLHDFDRDHVLSRLI
jgi:hypothetical protein